jgi:hypothetical protein
VLPTTVAVAETFEVAHHLVARFAAGDVKALGALFAEDIWGSALQRCVCFAQRRSAPGDGGGMAPSTDQRYENVRRDALAGVVSCSSTLPCSTSPTSPAARHRSRYASSLRIDGDGLIYRIDDYSDRSGLAD